MAAKQDLSFEGLHKSDAQLKTLDTAKWYKLATDEQIAKLKQSMEAKKFNLVLVDDKAAALKAIVDLIPAGASISNGASTTLVRFASLATRQSSVLEVEFAFVFQTLFAASTF